MKETLTRAEVEARLRSKAEAITRRIDDLGEEVTATGAEVKALFDSPLVRVGATLALGLAVGWLAGGRRRAVRQGLDAVIDGIARETARAVERGGDPADAVREALHHRAPLLAPPAEPRRAPGVVRQSLGFLFRIGASIAIRNGVEMLAARHAEPAASSKATEP